MKMSLPRGIIYHRLSTELLSLIQATYQNLDDQKVVRSWETKFAEYIDRKYSVAFPFARTAIYFALKSQNLPKGSEIIMPPITIKGILDVVMELGLKPVFVDINSKTFCFDLEGLKKAINPNTKAIIFTYLFGVVPEIDKLFKLIKDRNIFSIEDFSQSLNCSFDGKKLGCFGDVGVYSASSIKTLDTYGGGLLVCDDKLIYDELKIVQNTLQSPSRTFLIKKIIINFIRNFATTRLPFHVLVFPLIKFMAKASPGSVMKHTGDRDKRMVSSLPKAWFQRYSSLQAKLGQKLINHVVTYDAKRINNVEFLKKTCNNLSFPLKEENTKNVYWQLVLFFKNPEGVQKIMHKNGIDTATTSLEKISNLKDYPFRNATPNADLIYTNGLFIPTFPGLSDKELHHVSVVLNNDTIEKL